MGAILIPKGTSTVTVKGKKHQADSFMLIVPENRAKPDSKSIEIPVLRLAALNGKPKSAVFNLSGGPGMSNLLSEVPARYAEDHDYVMVGYRGVDGGAKLDFPSVSRAFRDLDGAMSQDYLKKVGAAFDADAAKIGREGWDLSAYTIPQTLADIEAARAALGYERIDIASVSYGTRLAYLYSVKHQDRVRRVIMVGANPPGRFLWEPSMVETKAEAMARLWAGDDERKQGVYPSLRSILDGMPERWLFFPLNAAKIRCFAFLMLFRGDAACLVLDAFLAAKEGDYSGLAFMSLSYDFMVPGFLYWGDLAMKGGTADADPARDYEDAMYPERAAFGSPMGALLFGWARYASLRLEPIGEEYRTLSDSDAETLVVSGDLDVSTPFEYARDELLPRLKRGTQVVVRGAGHLDITGKQAEGFDRLVRSFLDTGIPDQSGLGELRIAKEPSIRFGFIAKLASTLIFVLGIALIGGAVAALAFI